MTDAGEKKISTRSLAAALMNDAAELIALAAVSYAESVSVHAATIKAWQEGSPTPEISTPYADILIDRLRGCGVLDGEEEEES